MIKAYNTRMKYETDERITQAYLTAYWNRVKEMPTLKEVLGIEEEKPETDFLSFIKTLNESFGGTVY